MTIYAKNIKYHMEYYVTGPFFLVPAAIFTVILLQNKRRSLHFSISSPLLSSSVPPQIYRYIIEKRIFFCVFFVIDLYLIYLKATVRNGGIDAVWAVGILLSSVSRCLLSMQLGVSIASGIQELLISTMKHF